jgi:hypothetical protein
MVMRSKRDENRMEAPSGVLNGSVTRTVRGGASGNDPRREGMYSEANTRNRIMG